MTIDRYSAQDELTIVREMRKIRDNFFKENQKTKRIVIVDIIGDQPVSKILFRLWYSYLEDYITGEDGSPSSLPLDGAFVRLVSCRQARNYPNHQEFSVGVQSRGTYPFFWSI